MKKTIKSVGLIVWLCLLLTMVLATNVIAAETQPNVTMTVDKTTVEAGDEITVELANPAMNFQGLSLKLKYDPELVECTAMLNVDGEDGDDDLFMYYLNSKGKEKEMAPTVSDLVEDMADGQFSFAMMPGEDTDFVEGTIVTFTFVALKDGDVTFTLEEHCVGTDAFKGETSHIVQIGSSEPEHTCSLQHAFAEDATCMSGGNIEYWYCTDAECGKYFSDANGTNEITDKESVKIPVNSENHVKSEGVCDCGHCFHSSTKIVANNSGANHNIVCANTNCGETLGTEACTGGIATCTAKATCEKCGAYYGSENENNHTYGNLIPAADAVHTTNELKGAVAAHYLCACGKYFTESKVKTTLDELTGPAPEHTATHYYYFNNNPTKHSVYCSCGYNLGTEGHSGGEATCNAFASCEHCGTAYGGYNPDNHVGDDVRGASTPNNNGTHTVTINCSACSDEKRTEIEACSGGTANCLNPAACECCGGLYGDKDSNNHGNFGTVIGDNNNDGTHKICCEACLSVLSYESHTYGENHMCECSAVEPTGWVQIDTSWYYVYEDYTKATGLSRVPFPTVAINGYTYAPDQATIDYCNSKGIEFIDELTGLFYFDENTGLFDYYMNGILSDSYYVNGYQPWNYGLAYIGGDYYYFIGNEGVGGNIAAEGLTYIVRTNGYTVYNVGEAYYFGNGLVTTLTGIEDGKYFENGKLMMGAGLVKYNSNYYYVRSNGAVATGEYWVTNTNGLVPAGVFTFDENGCMQTVKDPTVTGLVDGVYYKNGNPYYAGLVELSGKTYYVKSNGEIATGAYYVTKVSNYEGELDIQSGDKLVFDENGVMQPIKNGIVEENDGLYYYVNNHVQYGAGLVELGDGSIIYVRSNGQLAVGEYWPTTLNGVLPAGKYIFDENGKLYID